MNNKFKLLWWRTRLWISANFQRGRVKKSKKEKNEAQRQDGRGHFFFIVRRSGFLLVQPALSENSDEQ
jgi:hypothetical protein